MAVRAAAAAPLLKLPAVFSDGAVLQAGAPVPVWGWATPRTRVTVRVAGQEQRATAGRDGRWQVRLAPLTPGSVGDLAVSAGETTVVAHDLLAGEVWICSGQSNMGFGLSGALHGADEVKSATDPQIRLFQQEGLVAAVPLADTGARWKSCSPETAGPFSAVGYFFGRELRRALGVPVGLINASWGGTNIECWMDEAALGGTRGGKAGLEAWRARLRKDPGLVRGAWSLEVKDIAFVPAGGGAAVPLAEVATAAEWNEAWTGSGATISFTTTGRDGARLAVVMPPAGWAQATRQIAATEAGIDLTGFAGVRFAARGSGRYRLRMTQKDVWPWEAHRSEPFLPSARWATVTVLFDSVKPIDWAPQKPFNAAAVRSLCFLAESGLGPNDVPTGLFNGEVAPVVPYGIRGAIWYQGENNAWMAERYGELFPAMIRGWRRLWGRGDFPFYFVQLANWQKASEDAQDSAWAELREAQAMTLSLTNTGMAVAIDVGDAADIHPKDKQSVGRRLALNALARTYGRDVEDSGPVFRAQAAEGAALRLSFGHAAGGLVAKAGPLKGFAVAGADRVFHRATARIEGEALLVSAPDVPHPVAARYAWADNPVCNLYNAAGLPASPFRTDAWPGTTAGK